MDMQRRHEGFTLVELMVVITILGMLAGIVAMNSVGLTDHAAIQITKTTVVNTDEDVKTFYAQHRRLPDSMEELVGDNDTPGLDAREAPYDAWNHPIEYERLGPREYTIRSLGADGIEGGEDIDADIDVRAARSRETDAPK